VEVSVLNLSYAERIAKDHYRSTISFLLSGDEKLFALFASLKIASEEPTTAERCVEIVYRRSYLIAPVSYRLISFIS
jgi:hypothetical protein